MSEQLKHKMHQWEAEPPPGCWDIIASRLDGAISPAAVKLHHLELAPPPASWNTIVTALEEAGPSKAPVRTINRKPYRMAAAAIIILLLAGGARLARNYFSKKELAIKQVHAPASSHLPVPAGVAVNNGAQNNEEDNTETPGGYTGNSSTTHKPAPADARTLKYASMSVQPAAQEYPITVNHTSLPGAGETPMCKIDPLLTNADYLIITGPNGETTRASMKMADALRYLYGENGTEDAGDKTTNESSNWKKRLQEWRNKIVKAHFIPASTNFLDIIDLKDLIEEKP